MSQEAEYYGSSGYDLSMFWRQRDGTLICIQDMGESHLRNSIRMVFRRVCAEMVTAYMSAMKSNGDMATLGISDEFSSLMSTSPSNIIRTMSSATQTALLSEWSRRGYADDTWVDHAGQDVINNVMIGMLREKRKKQRLSILMTNSRHKIRC